ncbi:ATP-binding protein [Streptomyces actinomycinicus]|uniref:ATP-binding protein n=1 Tax=Streptomyces actinomycinicus TaxID=1695166 RepID=A0A937JSP2_9ACTN|nr:ATP-binding protein [Streptomyces actinomycinicus]MBL1087686.1 ATP-binding protein [Streptomyces actinomycinicus]
MRLTGPAGSGRTALLEAVAQDCAGVAPDGVIRVCGHGRTPEGLLHALFTAVFDAPSYRPDDATLRTQVRDVSAVVVVDDLTFGGGALEEVLSATPECTYLLAATPEVPAPAAGSRLEELFLCGLGRDAALELVRWTVDRPLTDEEATWAGDVWFQCEGLPLRLVQAGALLRQRDLSCTRPQDPGRKGTGAPDRLREVRLPHPLHGAALSAPLASRLSEAAREALRLVVTLGGAVPGQVHLPSLLGGAHAGGAVAELVSCGLLTPVGAGYRLSAAVAAQLADEHGGRSAARAYVSARHYTVWTRIPSVGPARAVTEAEAMLGALATITSADDQSHLTTAVLLARTAAPVFAASLDWDLWERVLRSGLEAARLARYAEQEAYFLHELGILALCRGELDQARTRLERALGLRSSLNDERGTVAARRTLALVADLASHQAAPGPRPRTSGLPQGRAGKPVPSPMETPASHPLHGPQEEPAGPSTPRHLPLAPSSSAADAGAVRRRPGDAAARHRAALAAGALLVTVLATVLVLTVWSDGGSPPAPGSADQPSAQDRPGAPGRSPGEPADGPTRLPVQNSRGLASMTPRGTTDSNGSFSAAGRSASTESPGTTSDTGPVPGPGRPRVSPPGGASPVASPSGGTASGGSPGGVAAAGGTGAGGTGTGTGGSDPGGAAVGGAGSSGMVTGGTGVGGTDPGGEDTAGTGSGGATTGGLDIGGTDTGGAGPGDPDEGGQAAVDAPPHRRLPLGVAATLLGRARRLADMPFSSHRLHSAAE